MIYDFHVHSSISKDSNESLMAMVNSARDKDVTGMCFTQHLDPFFPDDFEPFFIDWQKYNEEIYNARIMFPQMDIYVGVEAGLHPNAYEEINKQIEENNIDFVLGSMHTTKEMTIGEGDYYERYTKRQIQETYMNELIENIKAFDNFDCVAHIGFVAKFAKESGWDIHYSEFSDQVDMLLKTIIQKGKGIEMNTSSLKRGEYTLPSIDIIKRYNELKGEIITIGSDAHSKEFVGYEFEYAKAILRKNGTKYLSKYENRKPVFYEF